MVTPPWPLVRHELGTAGDTRATCGLSRAGTEKVLLVPLPGVLTSVCAPLPGAQQAPGNCWVLSPRTGRERARGVGILGKVLSTSRACHQPSHAHSWAVGGNSVGTSLQPSLQSPVEAIWGVLSGSVGEMETRRESLVSCPKRVVETC